MHRIYPMLAVLLIGASLSLTISASPEKEYLTEKEIAELQDAQEINARVKIYMEAAQLRLKAAEERLAGKESSPGDPLEYFTPEDMLDGYYRILQSAITILDDIFQHGGSGRDETGKALKTLKGAMEHAGKELEILKKQAEEQKKEELWNLVNRATAITQGALEGAEYGLTKLRALPDQKRLAR